jgi:MFS family permease
MSVSGKFLKYAKLKPSEEKNFRLLFIQSMLSGFATSIFFVVVSAYFIKITGIASLPKAYIISGVFGYLLTAVYKIRVRKSGSVAGYSIVLLSFGILSVILLACRYLIPDRSPLSLYVAYAGFTVVLPFVAILALGFSSITLRVFNISQSKRLLALIGAGEVSASIIAYLSVPLLTRLAGGYTPALLVFTALANFCAVYALQNVYRHNKEKLDAGRVARQVKTLPLSFFTNNKFYALIAIVATLAVFANYFTDYSYLVAVRYIHVDTDLDIAAIVAIIFSVIKSGELIFSLLSGAIISARGMKFALLVQPLVLLGFSVAAAICGLLNAEVSYFIIIFLLLNKLAVRVVGRSLTVPAMKVLYQVTDPNDRAQLQTSVDGTINQYATIIAGTLLLVISTFHGDISFMGDKTEYLEKIISYLVLLSFVCIPVFALWYFVSLKLFVNYKIKIKEYLYQLIKTEKHYATDTEDVPPDAPVITEHHPLITNVIKGSPALTLKELNDYIIFYNPALKSVAGEESFYLSLLKRAYYNNENFFSRLLIIWHTAFQPVMARVNFVKEFYYVSDLHLKCQMIIMLNSGGYKPSKEHLFFFTSLCENCIQDIIWTEASMYDIAEKVDQELTNAFSEHLETQQNLLFELLKVLYEKESIKAIQDIVNSKDQSADNQLFAIELMDNLLEDEMKRMIIPLFEDISFPAKMVKLQKIFLVYNLSCADRLKEILMTNFMTVGPHVKQHALGEYYRLTGDKNILMAFSSSSVENLKAIASILLDASEEELFHDKRSTLEDIRLAHSMPPSMVAHFMKWGLFSSGKKGSINAHKNAAKQTYQFNSDFIESISSGNNKLSLDMLGLSLLFRINK